MITFAQLQAFPLPQSLLDASATEQAKVLKQAVARLHPYGITIDDELADHELAALADLVSDLWLRPTGDVDLSRFSQRTLGVPRQNLPNPIPMGDGTASQSASQSASGPGVDATARAEAQAAQRAADAAQVTADQGVADAATAKGAADAAKKAADAAQGDADAAQAAADANKALIDAIPTGQGSGVSLGTVRTLANDAANTAVENGVQPWARAAPGNQDRNGDQLYPSADTLAPDAEHGQALMAHRNGSSFWGDPAFPAVVQVSPSHIDKANIPAYFRIAVHTKPNAFETATKLKITFLGRAVDVAYKPSVILHTSNFQVTAAMRTAIAALATAGVAGEVKVNVSPRTAADAITGPGVIPAFDMQVIESAAGSAVLTPLQQVGLLNIEPEDAAIRYDTGALEAALTPAINVRIANPEIVTGDLWVEGSIEGQPSLARRKWSSAIASLALTLPAGNRQAVETALLTDGEEPSLAIDLSFYDAANAGNLIEIRKVHVALAERQLPNPTVASRGKVPAVKSDGSAFELIDPLGLDDGDTVFRSVPRADGVVPLVSGYPTGCYWAFTNDPITADEVEALRNPSDLAKHSFLFKNASTTCVEHDNFGRCVRSVNNPYYSDYWRDDRGVFPADGSQTKVYLQVLSTSKVFQFESTASLILAGSEGRIAPSNIVDDFTTTQEIDFMGSKWWLLTTNAIPRNWALPTTENKGHRVFSWSFSSGDLPFPGTGFSEGTSISETVKSLVQDWAEIGNEDQIPLSKLQLIPGLSRTGGLNQIQVDNRVKSLVSDWAETGNTAKIPSEKLTSDLPNTASGDAGKLVAVNDDGTAYELVDPVTDGGSSGGQSNESGYNATELYYRENINSQDFTSATISPSNYTKLRNGRKLIFVMGDTIKSGIVEIDLLAIRAEGGFGNDLSKASSVPRQHTYLTPLTAIANDAGGPYALGSLTISRSQCTFGMKARGRVTNLRVILVE